ncbi:MAG TPA: radical SAM protein [Candidatus Udaeobacter sp.]|nr:radical SAM protein [Candidatus Udaeobacter sp.]
MIKISPIFFHGNPGEGMAERFETKMMPNSSIAVLNNISSALGYPGVCVDEGYLGVGNTALGVLISLIEERLRLGFQPVILATILIYNAQTTLSLLEQLKRLYQGRIKVGVGGQLIRVCPSAYLSRDYLDYIAVGDAEETLRKVYAGDRFSNGYVEGASKDSYALPNYDNYLALAERLEETSSYRMGPFTNIRQLTMESVRGCAWAYANQVCDMCSLQGVDLKPVFRNLAEHFWFERQMADRWGATWCFDVSNQWLPTLRPGEMVSWLSNYCQERENYFGKEGGLSKFVYLTANSINPETAPLLKRAGIRIAYIGFDGWDKRTRLALHKPQPSIRRVLQICRDNGIHVKTGLVIGNGVTDSNLGELPDFVQDVLAEFGDIIRAWGNFVQIILPGSPVFERFKHQATKNKWAEVLALYRKFEEDGYFVWSDQSRLNRLFIEHTQPVSYDRLIQARDKTEKIVAASPHTSGVTIEHGGVFK